jgi:hypothetical protein
MNQSAHGIASAHGKAPKKLVKDAEAAERELSRSQDLDIGRRSTNVFSQRPQMKVHRTS